jgi:hypothetical protein
VIRSLDANASGSGFISHRIDRWLDEPTSTECDRVLNGGESRSSEQIGNRRMLPGCRVTQHRPFQFLDITGSYLGSHAEINQPHFTATRLIHGVIRLCLIEGKSRQRREAMNRRKLWHVESERPLYDFRRQLAFLWFWQLLESVQEFFD